MKIGLAICLLLVATVAWSFFGKTTYQGTTYRLTIPRDHTQATLIGGGKERYAAEVWNYHAGEPEFTFETHLGANQLRVDRIRRPTTADAYQVFAIDDDEAKKTLDTLFPQ